MLHETSKYRILVTFHSYGGGFELPINIHEINCAGNESRLIDCEYEVYTHFYCHHSENVAIACDGEFVHVQQAKNFINCL